MNNNRTKALFFDIDGTLLSEKTRRVPDSAKEALKQAREARGWTQAYVAELVGKTDKTIMNIENKGQHPSFNLFFKLVTLFDISVDQFFYTEGNRGGDSCRKHIDVLLDSMNEKELVVMEATAEGLKKARETEVQEVWLFCVSSMYWWKQSKHGLLY
mgnify:CR=1 FL=1